jgi:hypothetical protein
MMKIYGTDERKQVDVRQREQYRNALNASTLFEIKAGITNPTGIQLIDTIQMIW